MSLIQDARAHAVPTGTRLIVFGSQAPGDARADSDIDLLVVEPDLARERSRCESRFRLVRCRPVGGLPGDTSLSTDSKPHDGGCGGEGLF